MFFFVLLTIILAVIVLQDFKHREVSLILFILLFLFSFIKTYREIELKLTLFYTSFNSLILLIQIILIWSWFRIKNKDKINFFEKYLGLGDVLFYIGITPLFPPIHYIIYYEISLIFSLISWIIMKRKSKFNTIPLAGYASILLILFLGYYDFFRFWNF